MKKIIVIKKDKNGLYVDLNKKLSGVDMYLAVLMQLSIIIDSREKEENEDEAKYIDKFFRNLKADYKKNCKEIK